MDNIMVETIQALGAILASQIFVSIALVQYLKEKWGLEGKAAEITSLIVGFVLGALVAVSYLAQMDWEVSVSRGIGVFLFLVMATLGPSGGYKTLRTLLGAETP